MINTVKCPYCLAEHLLVKIGPRQLKCWKCGRLFVPKETIEHFERQKVER